MKLLPLFVLSTFLSTAALAAGMPLKSSTCRIWSTVDDGFPPSEILEENEFPVISILRSYGFEVPNFLDGVVYPNTRQPGDLVLGTRRAHCRALGVLGLQNCEAEFSIQQVVKQNGEITLPSGEVTPTYEMKEVMELRGKRVSSYGLYYALLLQVLKRNPLACDRGE